MITGIFLSPGKESIAIELDDGDGGIVVYEYGYAEVEEVDELDGTWIKMAVPTKPEPHATFTIHQNTVDRTVMTARVSYVDTDGQKYSMHLPVNEALNDQAYLDTIMRSLIDKSKRESSEPLAT